ncbi:hypothetical protein E2562_022960 [Oryza meyeriana var. granulata]|uniref:Uncharacterized protein n=1 Tax=Oryza meyeriana var. granulata TaxID=110450 RepID=A0A6G1D6Z5_9ORYZ|nr:hypothetical protein E2562_022960 [Oryza meyeriana var. granulata]
MPSPVSRSGMLCPHQCGEGPPYCRQAFADGKHSGNGREWIGGCKLIRRGRSMGSVIGDLVGEDGESAMEEREAHRWPVPHDHVWDGGKCSRGKGSK